nr:uncharacterized protein LOC109742131 isoform X1 [Aegilops tauschii subsp. strangulata]XP_020156794.1 uncharacterized protein LOC109742131 isoform X1 [Aegilops tauschii subsp. strangulata]XP_040242922.1 uncharacterized protein LOC109742131 isoform X1 [Aegilops tauschii subsp. strangulata]XP_040242923.1 uncharacterized protein LOC109742131 isoform X1 [Aegilops tauschii subsp. strangulata]
MGRLMKAFGKGTSAACVEDCDDSDGDPFVPNDFAEGDPFQASEESQMDDPDFDKALYEFYVSRKVNCLKWKITDAGARNVVFYFVVVYISFFFMQLLYDRYGYKF